MTKDFTQRGICRAKKGLLFLRDCGAPATTQCTKCGRPVCQQHIVPGGQGNLCPDCVAQDQPEPAAGAGGRPNMVTRTQTRRQYYDMYHYTPFYFGHSHYYSDRDYRTFDDRPEAAQAVGDDQVDGPDAEGDFDNVDDFMES